MPVFVSRTGQTSDSLWSPEAAAKSTLDMKALQKFISLLLKWHNYFLSFNLFCKGLLHGGDTRQGQAKAQKLVRRKLHHHCLCSSVCKSHTASVFGWMTLASWRICQVGNRSHTLSSNLENNHPLCAGRSLMIKNASCEFSTVTRMMSREVLMYLISSQRKKLS